MIPKECKRLAEVDFPIAVVSKHSAREKSIRHGHPSTLHLWWARRPLAACRAMLLGLLLPDPCDSYCPDEFKKEARNLLSRIQGKIGSTDKDLREALLNFIGTFSNWDLASDPVFLEISRALVKAAHPEETPLVVDPFAGGGSIPLEALRLGCETFASDLNPVACLILKVMLEDIPRHGPGLAEELRQVGAEIKAAAEKELAEFYPGDPDGARPIAYLWARTVRCESPNCGAEIPLMRSFWLCKKANRKRALRYKIAKSRRRDTAPTVEFEIFEPASESEVPTGTVTRAKAKCICCGAVLAPERVRAQLSAQRGGADVVFDTKGNRIGGARLLAIVTLRDDEPGRHYRLPISRDYEAVWKAQYKVEQVASQKLPNGLNQIPDEPTPAGGGSGAGRAFSVQKYGMMKFGDLFTARQKLALVTTVSVCREYKSNIIKELLSMSNGRRADHWSANAIWIQDLEAVAHTFGRQALPIVWDYVETVGFGDGGATFEGQIDWIARVIESLGPSLPNKGQINLADASEYPLPDNSAAIWFTDPPYYDAIPYSDLSDYFFVWTKRFLINHNYLRDPFDPKNSLTPKNEEAVQDETKKFKNQKKDKVFFEAKMTTCFKEGRRVIYLDGIGSVIFAHKTTEGWEALLTGLLNSGWVITASWPISTERPVRLRSLQSAALATSVHLVCRPRPADAPVGDWAEVLHKLPKRVGDWMERLQLEGVRGADLVFACIGPALEIFSRYSRVETAEGQEVKLPEFLEKVWEVVGRSALEQVLGTAAAKARNGVAGAVEEDARLTALFLWTLQSTNGKTIDSDADETEEEVDNDEDEDTQSQTKKKGFSLIFDVVRRFAQPLGISLPKWEGRIIETKKGIVRLLPVSERSQQLFGEAGAHAAADILEENPTEIVSFNLFPEIDWGTITKTKSRKTKKQKFVGAEVSDDALQARHEATTLDRVHAAMLLQAGGRTHALRTLLKSEQERGPQFLRLANALSALYPPGSEEKRLLDAMLLAVPR